MGDRQSKPKTPSSEGIVALDPNTVRVLRADEAGPVWAPIGSRMTCSDGSPLHPADMADECARLIKRAGLPPITQHGLRHGAAPLALGAGVDVKAIQHILRH